MAAVSRASGGGAPMDQLTSGTRGTDSPVIDLGRHLLPARPSANDDDDDDDADRRPAGGGDGDSWCRTPRRTYLSGRRKLIVPYATGGGGLT